MYKEKEKYIFISYAHKDLPEVLPVINYLRSKGFSVWYDDGIEAGSEWPEYIAEKLLGSAVVLAFLSENSVASDNCRREINFALAEKKELLIVYMQDLRLTPGMRLQLNSLQAIHRSKFADDKSFYNGLANAEILRGCAKIAEQTDFQKIVNTQASSTNGRAQSEKTEPYRSTMFSENTNGDIPVLEFKTKKELVTKALDYYVIKRGPKIGSHTIRSAEVLRDTQKNNLMQIYGNCFRKEDMIMAIDKSIMETGKKGLVITDSLLCFPAGITEKERRIIKLGNVISAEIVRGELVIEFYDGTSIREREPVDGKEDICYILNIIAENIRRVITTPYKINPLIAAIRKANKSEEKNSETFLHNRFDFRAQLKKEQIVNAISLYARGVNPTEVIAIADQSDKKNGEKGFLITSKALYSSERRNNIPIIFSELKNVRFSDEGFLGKYLIFEWKNGKEEKYLYGSDANIIYILLSEILKSQN